MEQEREMGTTGPDDAGEAPAVPSKGRTDRRNLKCYPNDAATAYQFMTKEGPRQQKGMTKRERFAETALGGLCANAALVGQGLDDPDLVAAAAVDLADRLIVALNVHDPDKERAL
jgi:hypothetical protein